MAQVFGSITITVVNAASVKQIQYQWSQIIDHIENAASNGIVASDGGVIMIILNIMYTECSILQHSTIISSYCGPVELSTWWQSGKISLLYECFI